jgi:3-hydroxybutyrate dehydrogenase
MLRLWGRNNSVNVQKAIWCLEELKVPYERIDAGMQYGVVNTPQFRKMNPNGLVPVIEDGGAVIWESNAIVRYLGAKYGKGTLWPEDPAARAQSDKWMDWCATVYWPPMRTVFWGLVRTPPEKRNMEEIEAARKKGGEILKILDAALAGSDYIAGTQLTIGDIALGAISWRWFGIEMERPPAECGSLVQTLEPARGVQEKRAAAVELKTMTQPTFKDKIAVVTGAASGLGLAIAERLAADGAKLVVSDINADTGKEVAARLGGTFVQADMGKRADCRALVDQALAVYGTVHILVNNAGFQHVETIEAFPEDVWDKIQAVMLTARFLLTKYVWPAMRQQRWGRIINVSSIHGLVASPNKVAYVSAKHGLVGLTKTAALEGGAYGITANAICPAYVRTPLVDKQIADQARTRGIPPEEVIAKIMLEPAAVKRLIEPAEVADFVAYLCGESAAVITGAALTMDLGWTAR